MKLRLLLLTSLTMVAFAANSVFCRLALVDLNNDPLSFTLIRLLSGALILSVFILEKKKGPKEKFALKSLLAPLALFSYALFFSMSYVQIDAGTGALVLFACVQITMMLAAALQGQKLSPIEKIGSVLAIGGFVYLVLPGANVPPLGASLLMAISGVSWGVYSLLGKGKADPIKTTAQNFILTTPVVIVLILIYSVSLTNHGWIWAILSGSLTSGLGYVLWYVALKDLLTSTASIVQLSVPAIAAFGGVLFLNESISFRLVTASLLIFGGIILKIKGAPA